MLLLAKIALMVAGLVVQAVGDGAIPGSRLDRLNLRHLGLRMILVACFLPSGRRETNPLELGADWLIGLAWIASGLLKGLIGKVLWWAGLAALMGGMAWEAWTRDGVQGLLTIAAFAAGAGVLVLAMQWWGRRQIPRGRALQDGPGREAAR